jgi:hypothetical protein
MRGEKSRGDEPEADPARHERHLHVDIVDRGGVFERRVASACDKPMRKIPLGSVLRAARLEIVHDAQHAASRRWICRVTADGVRNSRSAARCNDPDSARTMNVRISSSMTDFQLLVEQYDVAKIAFDASANQP